MTRAIKTFALAAVLAIGLWLYSDLFASALAAFVRCPIAFICQ